MDEKIERLEKKFVGKQTGNLFVRDIVNKKLIYKDRSTTLRISEKAGGRYAGKDRFKENIFEVDLSNEQEARKFFKALGGQATLEKFQPPLVDGKISVKNTDEVALSRRMLRELGADLKNPDKDGYVGSYYEIDKDNFLKEIESDIKKGSDLSIWDDVFKNVVGFDISAFVDQVKAEIQLKKQQEEQRKNQEKQDSDSKEISEFQQKINELIKSHGADVVLSRLMDAYLGNKAVVEKVMSGEKTPSADAKYQIYLLSRTKA